MAKLMKTLLEYRRATYNSETYDKDLGKEIADVEIMLEQIKYLFHISNKELSDIKLNNVVSINNNCPAYAEGTSVPMTDEERVVHDIITSERHKLASLLSKLTYSDWSGLSWNELQEIVRFLEKFDVLFKRLKRE